MQAHLYLNWYFNRFPTSFNSLEEFSSVVGERPRDTFTLTKIDRETGTPLTESNFVWITDQSLAHATLGEFRPPVFPKGTRTPMEQATNDHRFRILTQAKITWAQAQNAKREHRQKLESDLAQLITRITDFVVSKGYTELDALDPSVLPEIPKLQAARERVQELMATLSNPRGTKPKNGTLSAPERLRREQRKAASAPNRIHTNKPGRPLERFIQVSVRIDSLTAFQKQSLGIPPEAQWIEAIGPNGRPSRRYKTKITVPNPKVAHLEPNPTTKTLEPAPHGTNQDNTPKTMDNAA